MQSLDLVPCHLDEDIVEVLAGASELEESEDILFCGWTLKKGLFFWAPRYFALTRRWLLCWCARRRRRPAPSGALLSRRHAASHAGTREARRR